MFNSFYGIIAMMAVLSAVAQVNAFPTFRTLSGKHAAKPELKTGYNFHLFPPWVAEIGEVGLIVLDFVWHHEIVDQIKEVGHQVSDIDVKLDALLAASPAASQVFQMRKSEAEEPKDWPTPPINVRNSADQVYGVEEEEDNDAIHLIWALGVIAIKVANWFAPVIGTH